MRRYLAVLKPVAVVPARGLVENVFNSLQCDFRGTVTINMYSKLITGFMERQYLFT